jgi:hypothetical protein
VVVGDELHDDRAEAAERLLAAVAEVAENRARYEKCPTPIGEIVGRLKTDYDSALRLDSSSH